MRERSVPETLDQTKNNTDTKDSQESLVLDNSSNLVLLLFGFLLGVVLLAFLCFLSFGLGILKIILDGVACADLISLEKVVCDGSEKLDRGKHVRGVEKERERGKRKSSAQIPVSY